MLKPIQSLEVRTTRFDPVEAELTITVVPSEPGDPLSIRGRLMGPRSRFHETVEVAYYLQAVPAEEGLLRARVIIPEANLWSPAAPFLYEGPVEVHQGEQLLEKVNAVHGLRLVRLKRKGLSLNGQPLHIRGLALGRSADADSIEQNAPRLAARGINLLVVPVTTHSAELWAAAERLGFFILGQLDGTDEELLWYAEEQLGRRVSAFGWLLPQGLTRQPQLWHNAMLHLHGGRGDVLIGVRLEELPLGVLPGHVSFVAGDEEFLPELEKASVPRLIIARRGETRDVAEDAKPEILGHVERT